MLRSEVMQEADSENLLLCPTTDLSSDDDSGAGLFNLTNSQMDAKSIGKSVVGVGRGRKAPASKRLIRQRKRPQCRDLWFV